MALDERKKKTLQLQKIKELNACVVMTHDDIKINIISKE